MEQSNLGWYVRNSVEPLIGGVKAAETMGYVDTVIKKKFKQNWMREKKELWKSKRMDSLLEKYQKQKIKKETWNWSSWKLKQKPCCVPHNNRQFRTGKQPNHHFVECVTRKVKQYLKL